ncbi:MAG: ankyrin repeat domain-containing protein [Rickettsiales bacterium]|jgi:ankyrin repeat protein|nr:ankyrin repeat domain-containing protein [Rickettsiales bacterium]
MRQKIKNKIKATVRSLTDTSRQVDSDKTNLMFHSYVIKGNLAKVTEIVNNNYKIINKRDNSYKTALDYAISIKRRDIISDLVLLGARVSMTFYDCVNDKNFLEALHQLETVNYNYNNIDCLGFAPIHYASGQGFEKSVRFLLKKKVDINIRSIHGETALKYALKQNRSGLIAGDC